MIKGRDFLPVRSFLGGLPGEASLRTRTGRAYYAAYLEALEYCVRYLGFQRVRGPSEHGGVARLIAVEDAGLAVNLENLRLLRNTADYDLSAETHTIETDAMWSGVLVRTILTRLDDLAASRNVEGKATVPEGSDDI